MYIYDPYNFIPKKINNDSGSILLRNGNETIGGHDYFNYQTTSTSTSTSITDNLNTFIYKRVSLVSNQSSFKIVER